jgi:uncharacterized protein (TIGR00369 family)
VVELKLDAVQTEALIRGGLPTAAAVIVEAVEPGMARVRLPYSERMLRPGGVISGPTLFAAADTAMYALVLSHVGPQLMAVTASFNMHFLNKAAPGDVRAQAQLLKLGRRLVVMEVRLWTGDDPQRIAAQVTGSYALPGS